MLAFLIVTLVLCSLSLLLSLLAFGKTAALPELAQHKREFGIRTWAVAIRLAYLVWAIYLLVKVV